MIFNAMVEALVIFKILFDIALELGKLMWNAAVGLVRLLINLMDSRSNSNKGMMSEDGDGRVDTTET